MVHKAKKGGLRALRFMRSPQPLSMKNPGFPFKQACLGLRHTKLNGESNGFP